VAAETGWPLDKVTRYAEPLLGERAYVAEQASAVEISRSRGGATLHQSVCVKVDVDPDTDSVSWDSYRNPEGRWVSPRSMTVPRSAPGCTRKPAAPSIRRTRAHAR